LPKEKNTEKPRSGLLYTLAQKLKLFFKKDTFDTSTIPESGYKPKKKAIFFIMGFILRFIRFSHRHYIVIIALVILISAALLPGFLKLQFEGDMSKLNASTPAIQEDMNRVLATVGDAASSTLLAVEGQDLEEALIRTEQLKKVLTSLKAEGVITSYTSPTDILPSRQQQLINSRRWQAYFSEEVKHKLRLQLKDAANQIDMREEFLLNAVKSLEVIPPKLDLKTYEQTIFNDILTNQIAVSKNGYMTITPVRLNSGTLEEIDTIQAKIAEAGLQAIIYNGKYFTQQIINLIFQEIKKVSLMVILVIFLLLLISNRNLLKTIAMLLPVLLSLYWTFGIMGWLGIKINITNCLVSVFVLGLVIDYSIFLSMSIDEVEDESSVDHLVLSYGAIIISAMTTMAALGTLAIARHPALYSIGITTLLAISCGLLAVLLIIPVMFRHKTRA
jgi:predicted RND superfamily exporter protein